MQYDLPYTISNGSGETLCFLSLEEDTAGDKLIIENFVDPGVGPIMHTHWLQDEVFTVVNGTIGYEIKGEGKKFAGPGETLFFKRGVAHRFWNAGTDTLHCKGYVQPANNVVFFLTSLFAAQVKTKSAQPETFDGAFLITKYKSEFDMDAMPVFVKRVVMPLIYTTGKLMGKYKHLRHAPAPCKQH